MLLIISICLISSVFYLWFKKNPTFEMILDSWSPQSSAINKTRLFLPARSTAESSLAPWIWQGCSHPRYSRILGQIKRQKYPISHPKWLSMTSLKIEKCSAHLRRKSCSIKYNYPSPLLLNSPMLCGPKKNRKRTIPGFLRVYSMLGFGNSKKVEKCTVPLTKLIGWDMKNSQ